MTARLFVREVGQREFTKNNGDFPDAEAAQKAGEDLCRNGNVEEFEVWSLVGAWSREWTLKRTDGSSTQ